MWKGIFPLENKLIEAREFAKSDLFKKEQQHWQIAKINLLIKKGYCLDDRRNIEICKSEKQVLYKFEDGGLTVSYPFLLSKNVLPEVHKLLLKKRFGIRSRCKT